jgi:hypothetical protein
MAFLPEKTRKPEEPTSLLERAAKKGEERFERIGRGTEGIRKVLKALFGAPDVLVKGAAKAALEGGVMVSLAGLELLLGAAALAKRGFETASKRLEGKVREAKTRALTRLEKLGGKARSYGQSQIEKIKGRINEISLSAEGYSLERKAGGLLKEKREERESEITLKVVFEGGGGEEAQAKLASFCEAGRERMEEIDSRAKEISKQLEINRGRIETIRNKRAKRVEARRAAMALRVTGIDMGYKKRA